jgi:hypothetical protein
MGVFENIFANLMTVVCSFGSNYRQLNYNARMENMTFTNC